MQINKAIRQVMRDKGVSLLSMAKAIGKERSGDVNARLYYSNMTFDKAVEMLDVLGYEVVIQERKPGARRADQIVIDQKEA
nr:MAG TPA: transcription repressor [Caudoviricetes sp.]